MSVLVAFGGARKMRSPEDVCLKGPDYGIRAAERSFSHSQSISCPLLPQCVPVTFFA